jgi:hypothetical protein
LEINPVKVGGGGLFVKQGENETEQVRRCRPEALLLAYAGRQGTPSKMLQGG